MTDHDVVSYADLNELAASEGPCITLAASIPTPDQLSTRLKNAIRAVESQTNDSALLAPIEDLAVNTQVDQVWANTLLLFRSHDVFRYYWLPRAQAEMAVVASRFQLRPALSLLTSEQRFHLLALSRGKVRLLECTPHTAREIDLAAAAPVSFAEWLHLSRPDHMLDNYATAGPSTGAMKSVQFGTGTEPDEDYVRHFWKEVDRGLRTLLRESYPPVLLAGVEYEVAMFRQTGAYPNLMDEAVYGAPDGMAEDVMLDRAREAAARTAPAPFRKAIEELEIHRERGTLATDVKAAIKAAYEGRVLDLIFASDAERRGKWDEIAFEARLDIGDEDLLNAAAIETIRRGGRAFEVDTGRMPVDSDIAAVLRY